MSISSVSSFSFSLSYAEFSLSRSGAAENQPSTNAVSDTTTAPTASDHHHGQFMQAVKITLIQFGISISGQGATPPATTQNNGTTTSDSSTVPANTSTSQTATPAGNGTSGSPDASTLSQALHAFMHAMFNAMNQAIQGSGGEGSGEREGDNDGDDRQGTSSSGSNSYTSASTKVSALLQSIQSDSTTTSTPTDAATTPTQSATVPTTTPTIPTATVAAPPSNSPLDELKKAFASLFDASNLQNNASTTPVTLQSFLESLVNNLSSLQTDHQSFSITGMVINISA